MIIRFWLRFFLVCICVLIYLCILESDGYFFTSSGNNEVLLHSPFARLNLEKVFGATFEYEMYQEMHFYIYC